jgi:NAD(P)H-dependent flavin oxidoreductase YrpB (nitropropane dioxygenase family)
MTSAERLPVIIQGGMGAGVSGWRLARAVALRGQLGVVSGTALDAILVRHLQDGDAGGHVRRAMQAFPIPGVSDAALRRYFLPGGRAPDQPYKLLPMHKQVVSVARAQLTMLAAFVEVHLAKEGHDGMVGINFLTKLQLPNLASLHGAMLAGVDCVLMGAGIPREIPGALDALAEHRPATMRFDVEGLAPGETEYLTFDPVAHGADPTVALTRPRFFAIVAANSLAATLARKANGRVDGFVIESWTAGGHNAPPRGELRLTDAGEPVYGERDVVDLGKLRELGLPFWLAGGTGSPEALERALAAGATGVQVGTLFAWCDESEFAAPIKREVLAQAARGGLRVVTDPRVSPTGYPFKVVRWEGDHRGARERERLCDLGYLRTAYRRDGGRIGYRCPAEPVGEYVNKGGALADTVGRQCVCNGLVAAIGLPQPRGAHEEEAPLITSGDDLVKLRTFLGGRARYGAHDVLDYLLSGGNALAESNPSAGQH